MKKNLFLLALIFVAKLNAQFCFQAAINYNNAGGTNGAFGICSADFNKDGINDLAIANDQSSSVSVFNGTGGGGFVLVNTVAVPANPQHIISADFNNDTYPDLAVACFGSSNFVVLINPGNGVFAGGTPFNVGNGCKSVVAADFNNDGNMDVGAVSATAGMFASYLGDGAGNFALAYNVGVGGTPFFICSADFNNDGKKDLAYVGNINNTLFASMGNGDGTFAAFSSVNNSLTGPYCVIPIDFNHDGKMDLVVSNGTSSSCVKFQGNGIGGFSLNGNFSVGSQPRNISIGNFNHDAYADLVTVNFGTADISPLEGTSLGFNNGPNYSTTGANPRSVVAADFNNDGLDDIATANNGNNSFSVFINTIPTVSAAGPTNICAGSSTTYTLWGANTYTWSPGGATTTTLTVNPSTTTTYYALGEVAGCSILDTLTILLTVNPLPSVTANANPTSVCPGTPVTLTGGGATTYTWSSGVVDGVPFPAPAGATTYTVWGTDGYSCMNSASVTVAPPVPVTPNICTATVDSLSVNNVIIWDKTLYPSADTFFVYRDTANNNYVVVGKIPYTNLSQFTDTARSIGAVNGDPNITTYRYKLSYVDTCGGLSAKSPYHNTIYNYNIGSLFLWNAYEIEGQPQPVPGLSNYVLKRDNLGQTGNYVTAATAGASATSINDPQYATWQTQADWRVETIWNIVCTPTFRLGNNETQGTIVKTKSNITNNRTTNISKILNQLVSVYPNPSTGNLFVKFNSNVTGKVTLKVFSALGAQVYSKFLINPAGEIAVDLNTFESGMYVVQLITDAGTVSKRIIKN